MKDILLCSSDTLLVKNLYGVLRDQGFFVDTVEHPSHAVREALNKRYDLAIVDVEPFGLPSDDAVAILRDLAPAMQVITIGSGSNASQDRSRDLEAVTKTMHAYAI